MKLKTGIGIIAAMFGGNAFAVDIEGVQPAALDQPRINAYISLNPGGDPLIADFGGGFTTFNIQAFFDTGASGILLSNNTADFLGVERDTFNGQEIIFSDVGVAGTDDFNVSAPVYISLARFHPDAFVDEESDLTEYTQTFGQVRTQIGPIGIAPDPILGDLDVFGVPLMQNKVVVMDPRPVNTFLDTMRTYVYNPGTPFNAAQDDTNPGIPELNSDDSFHIRLSKANFAPYTQVTPSGAPGPTLNGNPFIGPDPTQTPQAGDPPPVSVSFAGQSTSGSFLLDTGAAASMISTSLAEDLHIRYTPGTQGSDAPVLERFDPLNPQTPGTAIAEQFTLTVGGIGGTTKVAGFFLDSMLLPTVEGAIDPERNLNFVGAPVLVLDITVKDPVGGGTLTLDGIFGMNYLVASAFVTEAEPFPIIDGLTFGAFDWIVYDDANSMLGLELGSGAGPGISMLWIGWSDNTWAIGGDPSWGFPFPSTYEDGDAVEFGDFIFDNSSDTITILEPVAPGSVLFSNNLEEDGGVHYTLLGAPITGTTGVTKTGAGIVTFQNQNTYTGLTDLHNGTLELQARQDIGPVLVRENANLDMYTSQRFDALSVAGKARLMGGGDKVLVTDSIEITDQGQLDLADNRMVVDRNLTTTAQLRKALKAGYANGSWNGPGIVSSVAAASSLLDGLGYALAGELGITEFAGEPVTANSIVVRYTYLGDADLDGDVDGIDVGLWAQNFTGELGGTGSSVWSDGDWDYDGDVDGIDVGLWAQAFTGELGGGGLGSIVLDLPGINPHAASILQSMGITVVPEPGMCLIAAATLAGVCLRPRRRVHR